MRWNVQWWAALATVLAGLMSIPALVISMNALRVADEQRLDARRQKSKDDSRRRLTADILEEAGTEGVDFGDEYPQATRVLLNPHDDRWWYAASGFEEPAPVTREQLDILDRLGMSVFTPDRRTPLSGCV